MVTITAVGTHIQLANGVVYDSFPANLVRMRMDDAKTYIILDVSSDGLVMPKSYKFIESDFASGTIDDNYTDIQGIVSAAVLGLALKPDQTGTANSSVPVSVQNKLKRTLSASFTRPNNADLMAVNDVIGTSPAAVLNFGDATDINGGSGWLARLKVQVNQVTLSGISVRLHLFHTAPTAIADNDIYTLLNANKDKRCGFVDFVLQTEGTGSDSAWAVSETPKVFTCATGSKKLYGVLENKTQRTPVAQEQWYIELVVDPD